MGQILFNFLKHWCADSGALACCATLPMFSALGLAYAFLPEPLGEHEGKPIGSGLPVVPATKKKVSLLALGAWPSGRGTSTCFLTCCSREVSSPGVTGMKCVSPLSPIQLEMVIQAMQSVTQIAELNGVWRLRSSLKILIG